MLEFFTPKLVFYITSAFLIIIVILNFILNFNKAKNDTINNILVNWSNGRFFFITFLFGVLGGHFFLGSEKPLFNDNWWLPVVIITVISVVLYFIGKKKPEDFRIKQEYQVLLLVAGLMYGHFVWSQRHEAQVFDQNNTTNLPKYCDS